MAGLFQAPPGESSSMRAAQWARLDRRRAVFDARAAWRCPIHAAGVGRTQSRHRAGLLTVTNALPRLAALDGDPWEDFWKVAAQQMGKDRNGRCDQRPQRSISMRQQRVNPVVGKRPSVPSPKTYMQPQ